MTESRGWKAWMDEMPGKERTLHVSGYVTVPSTAHGARLVPERSGINPAIRMLRYEIYEKGDIGGDLMTEVEVDEYAEPTQAEYEQVTILPDGGTVDVEIAS